jgi:hypothetical protein
MDALIVTGGFLHSGKNPDAISTDVAALGGARSFCEERGVELTSRYEAWVPEPDMDRRPGIGDAVRMSEADGVTVRTLSGRTPLGRRLAMVRAVDIVVTISGRRHTEVVGEQALELGIPFLPIPIAGGDSASLLTTYHDRIAAAFPPGALERCLEVIRRTPEPPSAACAVVDLLLQAKIRKWLVLLPYDDEHNALYNRVIEPAVARHMTPTILNRLSGSGLILSHLTEAVDAASAIIADVTRLNHSVMYEIGFAHAQGLEPLVYTRDRKLLDRLPVYLTSRNVLYAE